jgi:hypothetical protein
MRCHVTVKRNPAGEQRVAAIDSPNIVVKHDDVGLLVQDGTNHRLYFWAWDVVESYSLSYGPDEVN